MTDIAALGLKIEGVQSIDQAAASLENLASAGKKTEAAAKGVSTGARAIKPAAEDAARATDKLTDAEKRLAAQAEKAGMSVKQMQFALRGLPAQFTDIAVSLQGGQAPLTVFLQQGGQLKDMFGGAGIAARAMAGYVSGLINPLSIAATAVVALGAAYYKGSKEADAFRVSLATTGNAIGTTTGSLTLYARQLAAAGETQGKAAEALNTFVSAGLKSESMLAQFAQTAIGWERATGEGVDVVAEKFVALEKDPLKAALKLQESMNFLTVEIYNQIKALEDQGDKIGAAAVAMGAYEAAMAKSTKVIVDNMGYLEYSAYVVTVGFKSMWDMVTGIGRQTPEVDKLAKAYEKLNDLVLQGAEVTPAGRRLVAQQQEQIRLIQDGIKASTEKADADKKQAQAVKELSDFDSKYKKHLEETLPLNQHLAKIREDAVKVGKSEADIVKILAYETEEYNKKHKTRTESTKSLENSYRTLAERANEYIKSLTLEAQQGEKVSRSQQLQIELDTLLARGKGKGTDALAARTKALIAEAKAMETSAKASKAMAEAAEQHTKEQQELDDYLAKQADAIGKQAKASADANKALEDETKLLDLQASLIGASTEERERAIEQMRIQIELEKELAALDGNKDLDAPARARAAEDARARSAKKIANVEKKIRIESANEINKYIEDGLYDSIVTGGASAKEALERMFKNLVLRPIVQGIVGGVLGGDSGSGSSGGIGGALSSGQSLYSAFSGGLTSTMASGVASLGATFGSSALTTFAAGMKGSTLAAGLAGPTTAGAGGLLGAGAGFAAALPWVGGALAIGSLLGSNLFSSGDDRHGVSVGVSNGQLSRNPIWEGASGDFATAKIEQEMLGAYQGINDVLSSLGSATRIAQVWAGLETSQKGRGGTFFGGQLTSGEQFGAAGWDRANYTQSLDFEQAYGQYSEQMAVGLLEALSKAADIPEWARQQFAGAQGLDGLNAALQQVAQIDAMFKALGQTMTSFASVSDDVITSLVAGFGVDGLQSVASGYYQNFYSEKERMETLSAQTQQALAGLNLEWLDPRAGDKAKEQFRATVETALQSGQGELAKHLLSLEGSFATAADYAQKSMASVADSVIDMSQLASDAADRLSQAWSNVQSASSLGATYTGNTSGLEAQLAILRASASSSTDTTDRLAAAQQIGQIEQELWNADQDNRNAAAKAAQQQEQALREQLSTVNALANAARGLRNFVEDLRTSELSGLTEAQRLSGLGSNYQKQLALANSGDADAFSDLQSTTRDFLSLSSQNATTQAEFNALSARTAAELEAAAVIQEASATTEQLMLEQQIAAAQVAQDIAQQQFKVSTGTKDLIEELLKESLYAFAFERENSESLLNSMQATASSISSLPQGLAGVFSSTVNPVLYGINNSISSLASAAWALVPKKDPEVPQYAVGTPYVPETGLALIHKGEAIIPAQYNPAANGGDMRVSASSSEDARMQNAAVIAVLNRVFRIIDEWNVDGLPHKREEYRT